MALRETFKDIADAIRVKRQYTRTIKPTEMAAEILRIGEIVEPLTFKANQDGCSIMLQKVGSPIDVSLEYYDEEDGIWDTFEVGTTYDLYSGDTIQIRATSNNPNGMGQSTSNYHKFVMTGGFIDSSGNIMSLYDKDFATKSIAMTSYGFRNLFDGCTSLTTAPELPATTLASNCYARMFQGCTSLRCAPVLPATTMSEYCYQYMFQGCTSLSVAPQLSVTTLENYCFQWMFVGSINLSSVKLTYTGNFSGAGVPDGAFNNWLGNVSSSGTMYYNGTDTTRGSSAIPGGWRVQSF